MEINDNRIAIWEFEKDFPNGIPVKLLMATQDAESPRAARLLVKAHLDCIVTDDPATTVYGRLLWHHMEAARKGDDPWREEIYAMIETYEKLFLSECKVWKDRYPVERG